MLEVSAGYANKVIRDFLKENGMAALKFEVLRALDKHKNNESITKAERVFCGLRYSEFFAGETTNTAYVAASDFADMLRQRYSIDFETLRQDLAKFGWQ